MTRILQIISSFALACLICASGPLHAQNFPALTGPVVDQANVLDPAAEQALSQKILAFKKENLAELTVVTLTSLEGYDISDYGWRLGEHWGIGDKKRDDGMLLIVAPNERKVRIDVGYGLEPKLTDFMASDIIGRQITPAFLKGDFAGGVNAGVDRMMSVARLSPEEAARLNKELAKQAAGQQAEDGIPIGAIIFIIILFFFILPMLKGRRGSPIIIFGPGIGGGFGGGGGGFGGGFGGGGGGFGGGGASGGW